ncbi:hypothetical protein GGR52DRAFT_221354 [Hypoxylon sp. FL1284]|nr:hypothetical protein GGR52DRAFT_221354 [Hypoxylon sp. FL1284]
MATPTPPKSMSSRLLTMKFMQRAAASPSASSPTNADPDEQASNRSKRRKVAHKSSAAGSKEPVAQINQAAVRAAIAEEERKRQEALVQHAAELGDARWVLDMPNKPTNLNHTIQAPMNVVQVGFAQIDSPNDASDAAGLDAESTDISHTRSPMVRRYNMDKKKMPKKSMPKNSDSENDTSDSEASSESDSDASSQEQKPGRSSRSQKSHAQADSPRPALRNKRSAEQIKAKQFAEKRRKKEVKLNSPKPPSNSGGLLSISSGGSTPSRPTVTCFSCNKPGHRSTECPSSTRRSAH